MFLIRLVKACCRNNATFVPKGFTKGRKLGYCLSFGIDRFVFIVLIRRKVRNLTPKHSRDLVGALSYDNRIHLSWPDVPARPEVSQPIINVKAVVDLFGIFD